MVEKSPNNKKNHQQIIKDVSLQYKYHINVEPGHVHEKYYIVNLFFFNMAFQSSSNVVGVKYDANIQKMGSFKSFLF